MAKKSAVFKDTNTNRETLTLTQNADNSISLEVNNIKGVLRLIANQLNFNYDAEWTTQQFGRELIKQISGDESAKRAEFKDKEETNAKITLIRNDDSSIELEVNNDKGLMRLIAKALNFAYDESWNTQTLGSKLIDVINNPTTSTAQSETATAEQEADSTDKFFRWSELGYKTVDEFYAAVERGDIEENEGSCISDGAWEWWKGLSDSMKFVLLRYVPEDVLESEFNTYIKAMPYLEDEVLYVDDSFEEEIDLANEAARADIDFFLQDYISEIDEINIRAVEGNYCDGSLQYDFEGLAYLPELTKITFEYTYIAEFPPSLISLPHLREVNMYRSNVGEDDIERDIENLFAFAKSHPKLEQLNLDRTELGDYLQSEPKKFFELCALMPHCLIQVGLCDNLGFEEIAKMRSSINAEELKELDLSQIGFELYSKEDELFALVMANPQLEKLNVSYTQLAEDLANNPEKVAVLRALMPKGEIISHLELSNDIADKETVAKYFESEMVLWWKEADDFSRYAYILERITGWSSGLRDLDFELPEFDDSNGFKIISSELDLNDIFANKAVLWKDLNGFDPTRKGYLSLSSLEEKINNVEKYDFSHLNKIYNLSYNNNDEDDEKEFPYHLSQMKGLRLIKCKNVPQKNVTGFESLEYLTLIGSELSFPVALAELKTLKSLEFEARDWSEKVEILSIPDDLSGFEGLETICITNSCECLSVEDVIKFAQLPSVNYIKLPRSLEEFEEQIKQHFSENVTILF